MSGEMRRPPQLWEQRLARTTAILGAGISSSGDATAIVPPSPAPGSGGGTEPAPVAPPVGSFSTPSTPTLIGAVTGINVVWNGLNSAGDLWPSDTSFVEVHMSTAGTGFTPDASTLKGRLVRPGGLAVVGLTSGVTYHFRLRGADPAGNFTSSSAAASGSPGLITAPDIAAGAITANSITAGTITGWSINAAYLSGGTVSGGFITGGTISGGTVTGASITTSAFNPRVALNDGGGRAAYLDIFSANNAQHSIYGNLGDLIISPSSRLKVGTSVQIEGDLDFVGAGNGDITATSLSTTGGIDVTGSDVFMPGVYGNNTTGIDSVGITTGNRLRRISSSQAIKYDIATVTKPLSPSVDPAKVCDVVTVNPTALLDVAVVEFSVIDDGEPTDRRVLGFIAEDVADKLPIAVSRDANGNPAGVLDTSLLAALLAVVQDQQQMIDDLTARIEALEA
jgi:hypothetical protein